MRWWALVASIVVVVALLLLLGVALMRPLPVLATAPSYDLIDQSGLPIHDTDLRGRIALYDFIYTSCTTVCPVMTGQMLQIQSALADVGWLGNEVVLISITFDPERDTPARLREYATQMQARPDGWLWLTGDLIEIKQLVGGEFGVYFEKVGAGEGHAMHGMDEAGYDFVHDTTFTLVDDQGRLRAEYHSFPGLDVMMRDIGSLVREKNARGPMRLAWQAAHWLRGNAR